MTLNRTNLGLRGAPYPDLIRVLFIIAAVIVAMLVLTAIFGIGQPGPSLEFAPDPAAGMGLPF